MPLEIAVCGAGAFGRNHIRIYRELEAAGQPIHLAAVVDPDPARTESTASTPPSLSFLTVEALLSAIARGELHIDAASVCTPTSSHHEVAAQLLQAGIHVLVEKPIAATLDEADDLIALAHKHNRTLTVGHLERFNPAVQAVLPLLLGPMFFEAHRLSIFSPRSLDTDVVLDLMIHDLDIVLTLTQSPVTSVHAVGLPILSGRTDIANVRVEFASGCVANFTASRVSTERVRKLRFFQPHQYLSIDYARQDLLVIEVKAPEAAHSPDPAPSLDPTLAPTQAPEKVPTPGPLASPLTPTPRGGALPALTPPATALPAPTHELPTLGMQKTNIPPAEPLRLELESFLHSIQTRTEPTVTAAQARAALALALQIQKAIEAHAQHAGLQAFAAR